MEPIRSALASGVAALVILAPSAAHADSYVHADTVGDVVSVKKVSGATTPAPDQVEGDIVRTRVRHRTHRVKLKIVLRDLTQDGRGTVHYYAIRTKELTRIVTVEAKPGQWAGTATMFKPDGRRTHCHVRHRIDYDRNWARISVPRSCLDRPRWVRAAMQEITVTAGNVGYADDAQTNGQIYNRPEYGPRVLR